MPGRPACGTRGAAFRARFYLELSHHLLPDDDWLVAETAALADELGLPVVVTNDVHYARPEGREFQDVLTAIRHGRTLDELADLRRPDGESYLKSGAEMAALPPGDPAFARRDPRRPGRGREGIATAGELAASCSVDLGFEQYRFPGFPVPNGETPFSYLVELCQAGARKRYHPLTSAVVNRLAHELDVIERAGLAEFFLICWDLMRFAKEQGIPAQGRGSAASSIVAYTLGISRVEPIGHNLLFERFINEGRTTYPDVDIDFSSARREEVIQYVYNRYGPEHTGMVCNLVTYRARSAVREVGVALGFPRPLVDRVAKALETYDSVMVRRDLEADGGFAEFFKRTGEGEPAEVLAATEAEGARPRRRDGPAEHADPARREGAALAPAAEAGGPGCAAAVRLARREHRSAPRPRAAVRSGRRSPANPPSQQPRWYATTIASPESRRPASPALTGREDDRIERPIRTSRTAASVARTTPVAEGQDREARSVLPDELAPGRRSGRAGADDEGGPGDTPASVAWLRAGKGTGYAADARSAGRRRRWSMGARSIRRAARSSHRRARPIGWGGRAAGIRRRPPRRRWDEADVDQSSVARVEPEPPPQALGGHDEAPLGLGALARVLRPDRRLPAPSLDPQRRDARHGRAAHRHRPARAGDDAGSGRRPVRQARRRDAQADQARPARARDARRDRRDAPAHRARLRGLHRSRPPAGGHPGGLRDAPGGRHRRGLPGREPGPDADAAEVAAARASTISSSRSRSSGRARSRATPSTRTCAGSRASSR